MNLGDKKYYMGALLLAPDSPMLKTLDEAIRDCTKYLSNNLNVEERYIVEVIKVVKRVPPPVIVEDVE